MWLTSVVKSSNSAKALIKKRGTPSASITDFDFANNFCNDSKPEHMINKHHHGNNRLNIHVTTLEISLIFLLLLIVLIISDNSSNL